MTKTATKATVEDLLGVLADSGSYGILRTTGGELAEELGLKGSGEVRSLVHAARVKGHGVCADKDGYWLGSDEEVAETVASMLRRSRAILKAAEGLAGGLV